MAEDALDESNYSNRVIKAACNVARLCLDKQNIIKPINENQTFLEMMLKKIGQCVTVSDSRAQRAINKFILTKKTDSDRKEQKVEDKKQDKEKVEDVKTEEVVEDTKTIEEDSYFVFASINNSSEDCSFIVTAAYECDKLLNRHSQKSKPKEDEKVEKVEKKKDNEKAESKSESAVNTKAENNKYYQNLVKLIRYAMEVESSMKSRGTTKIAIKHNMTLAEAQTVCDIFYKAYEGGLKPMSISVETVNALKGQKLLNGLDVSQIYPSL